MKTIRTAMLRGKRWSVKDVKHLKKWIQGLPAKQRKDYFPGEEKQGLCVYEHKTLWIPIEGDTKEDLEVIIHESTHGCTELDEHAVTETARDIAEILWRLGWRKVE